MRPEETFVNIVRIPLGIDKAMVSPVIGAPLECRTLERGSADEKIGQLDCGLCVVASVSQKSMIAGCNGKIGEKTIAQKESK